MARLELGVDLPVFEAETLRGERVSSSAWRGKTLLLNFSRYAACPVCNNTLAGYRVRHGELEQAGVRLVNVFHSPADKLQRYLPPDELPFTVLADPKFRLYDLFGVERSLSMWANPKSTMALLRTVGGSVPINPLEADGTLHMRPANFLFDSAGRLAQFHYGSSLGDSWGVDEALAKARMQELGPTEAQLGDALLEPS